MHKIGKKALLYVGAIVFFLILAYGFVPEVLGGKIVNQSDISGYTGMVHEANEWNAAHPDDRTAWTNSMFGGMPTTMMTGNPEGDWTKGIYYRVFLAGRRPATYLFLALVGAFLLMLSLGVSTVLSVGGAVAAAFCSYNMQIIQVGHNTKMMAIAWLPWALAAVIFTYRTALGLYRAKKDCGGDGDGKSCAKSYLPLTVLGAALFGMAVNFQIKADHIQISYYLAIVIFCYVIGLFIWIAAKAERRWMMGRFFAASFLLLGLGLAGIGANANKLIPMYEYSHQTMRGGSELAADDEDGAGKSQGLDIEYATAWSYGWQELPNLMIPDFNGGSSAGAVNPSKSQTIKLLKQYGQTNVKELAKALPLYWGPQPFTAGPMYMGAITVFLFLLGLFMCKGRDKWWLFAATVIAVLLAVGNHFLPFTKFWYEYMPFYSKFRTVSMALVILQVTMPMLGFIALDRILRGEFSAEQFRKPGIAALWLTGGVCLLLWIFPSIAGSFSAPGDAQMHPDLASALQADRRALLRQDAMMSFWMITLTYLIILWAYAKPKAVSGKEAYAGSRSAAAALAISALVLINMFAVGKRYLNSDHFTTPRDFSGQFAERPVDKMILEDKSLDYRVLDLSVNVFNDSHPSYHHKNIGGYSPVKLQRYQDLIDYHLTGEINSLIKAVNSAGTMSALMDNFPKLPVISALNGKYIILDGNSAPVVNPYAMGNVWFVDSAVVAPTPKAEITMLDKVDLGRTAVIGADFSRAADEVESLPRTDAAGEAVSAVRDTVYMTSYAPNELRYHCRISSGRAAVFSEVYYPGVWTLKMIPEASQNGGGQELELFRTDWILRGAILPAGEYDMVMRCDIPCYKTASRISRASSILLILLVLLASAGAVATKLRGPSER